MDIIIFSQQEDLFEEIETHKESSKEFKVTVEYYMTQEDLQRLSNSNIGRQMRKLVIRPEYADGAPVLDFTEVPFLNLDCLEIESQSLKAVHFTKENTPLLSSLNIEQSVVESFHLDLPELVNMSVQFLEVKDPTGFGESLSRSPKLESFTGYKLWGLQVPRSKTHKLVLPNCEQLHLYRSDDLNYLTMWAPKLADLNLRACYSLKEVKILDLKPNGYLGPEYSFEGVPSDYEVDLINTDFQDNPRGNITSHKRCIKVITKTDADGFPIG